jgi:hypothetical protein
MFLNTCLTDEDPLRGTVDRYTTLLKFAPELIEARCSAPGGRSSSPSPALLYISKPLALASRSAPPSAHQIDIGSRLEERIG